MDTLTLGFIALVYFAGIATGWLTRASEEYMRKEDD